MSRESAVADAFVSLTTRLVEGADIVDLLGDVVADCADLLDVASVGLLLADPRGVLHVMAASSERTRNLELFQLQRDEGPCLDCYRSGAPVSVPSLTTRSHSWPAFVLRAMSAGFASVHAVPMRLKNARLGALGLFGSEPGTLNVADLRLAQGFAHVASVAVVAARDIADERAIAQQLLTAVHSRVVIEQAKGLLAQAGDLDMDQAFAMLRRAARARDAQLTEVAEALVSRSLRAQDVLDGDAGRP